jgi:tetratricopeptide (TPR) repeat protein
VERDYAEATTPDKLRAFVDAHPDHALAGVAELRVADAAYQSGQNADAISAYDRAASMLKTGVLAARAQLGGAITKIQAGQAAEGVATLHQLADDSKQFSNIRAEAYFHLASLAAEAGRAAEVQQIATQLMQVEPSSPWTQRAFGLQATAPVTAGSPAAAAPAPSGAIAFPSGK